VADPITSLSPALARYATAVDRARAPGEGGGEPAVTFGGVLEKVMTDALAAGQRSEAAATQAVIGQANLQDVVEAVNAAEVTLQTVVALRDRMISAYQEIIRMPI
jgi:flagellar hook-basal body complex protein FliE